MPPFNRLTPSGIRLERIGEHQVTLGKKAAAEIFPNIKEWRETALPGSRWTPFAETLVEHFNATGKQNLSSAIADAGLKVAKYPTLVQWHHFWSEVKQSSRAMHKTHKKELALKELNRLGLTIKEYPNGVFEMVEFLSSYPY